MTLTIYHHCQAILGTIHYGVVATVSPDGRPWNSPVVMLPDADLNFYWFSDADAQHSRNIATNPSVYIVVFDSTVPVFSAKIDRGLYIQAEAAAVTSQVEIERAYDLLGRPTKHRPANQRVYRATPRRIWINDVEKAGGTFVRDMRHPVDMPGLINYLHAHPAA